MTTQQEVFFSMVLKVKNFAAKNPSVIASVPGASAQFSQLNGLVSQLIAADSGGLADLTGFAISKAGKRQSLETLSLKMSNAISALAVNLSDVVLQKRADFPSSFWYKASDDELISQATILKNLATPQAAALVPYGVAAADITAFSTALEGFINSVSDPTLAIDQRKVDKEKVESLIDQIRTLLSEKLDVLMRILETTNRTQYELYQLARAQDQRAAATAPTVSTSVAPNTTATIHSALAYNENTFYTVQNIGNEAVQFSLSDAANTEGSEAVLIAPGETRSRQAQNLSPSGVHFTVKNLSPIAVAIKLWVE